MQLTQDSHRGHQITEQTEGSITIDGQLYTHSVLLSVDQLVNTPTITHIDDVTSATLDELAQLGREVILIGTGLRQLFPSNQLLRYAVEKQLAIEYMTTSAACRTFNVLMSEQRQVSALLIIE